MKSNLKFLFFLSLFTFSCSSEDTFFEEPLILNKIDFKINGQKPTNEIRNITSVFCCNENLFVDFDHWVPTSNGLGYGGSAFTIKLDKNGNLLALYYKDYTHPNNEFYSPFFIPNSTLNIENFEFVENTILKFEINGKIFKKTNNFFETPEFVNIDADIEIRKFNTCGCNSFYSRITNIYNFNFYSITKTEQANDIKYFAHTNNGYQIEFLNFNQPFRDMSLGVYNFDENSTSNRIDFRKFIGVPRAFTHMIISQEWLKYETSGNFEILEKNQQSNGEIVVKIKFNLIVKENNNTVYELTNALFETSM